MLGLNISQPSLYFSCFALDCGLCGYRDMRRASSMARHGIKYHVGMEATYAATTSTFVQSIRIFLDVPDEQVIIYRPNPPLRESRTLSAVPFICVLKTLPALFITRQSWGR